MASSSTLTASIPSSASASSFSRSMVYPLSKFAGSAQHRSNAPNGSATEAGTARVSGRRVFSSDRCSPLPPTRSSVKVVSTAAHTLASARARNSTGAPATAAAPAPPAAASASAVAGAEDTLPSESTPTVMAWPSRVRSGPSLSPSAQLTQSTFWLRARMATCESTSMLPSTTSPTMPAGMSSRPPSGPLTRITGESNVCPCTLARSATMTVPVTASEALTTCQGLMPAAERSMGVRYCSAMDRMNSGCPRTASSPKLRMYFSSTLAALPMASAWGCTCAYSLSMKEASARPVRSTVAVAAAASPPHMSVPRILRHPPRASPISSEYAVITPLRMISSHTSTSSSPLMALKSLRSMARRANFSSWQSRMATSRPPIPSWTACAIISRVSTVLPATHHSSRLFTISHRLATVASSRLPWLMTTMVWRSEPACTVLRIQR
mmetsp:Transcript_7102/g.14360  ORF Transcript_7102/g.14360 Transcript_7102/m.14360 type:complete len:438 (-) Transcript_7102:1481-2794(-)